MISLKKTLSAITSKFSALNTLLNDVPHYTLLWTNPNPTNSFSAQAISLDLSKYDMVEIEHSYISGGITGGCLTRAPINSATTYMNGANNHPAGTNLGAYRAFRATSTRIAFDTCYFNNETADRYFVPYKIYGIKFGGV